MATSPEDRPEKPKKVPGWRQPWHPWRITMLAGSIVLLAGAVGRAVAGGGLPRWLEFATQFVGFGLLVTGFALAMRMRREIKEKRAAEEKKRTRKDVSRAGPG